MSAQRKIDLAELREKGKRPLEAYIRYLEGIEMIEKNMNNAELSAEEMALGERRNEYMERAEQIRQKHLAQVQIAQIINISEDSTGHTYQNLFGQYFNSNLEEMIVEEEDLHKEYHFKNLARLFEMAVNKSRNLEYVCIITKKDNEANSQQQHFLDEFRLRLTQHQIRMDLKYKNIECGTKIVLGNGFIIKIDRGLDIFNEKDLSSSFVLGFTDTTFRKCLQTEIDVWRTVSSMS